MQRINAFGLSLTTLLVVLATPYGLHGQPSGNLAVSSVQAIASSPLLDVQGSLTPDDEVVEFDEGDRLIDVYAFEGSTGQLVSITLDSSDFDTLVLLLGPDGEVIDGNDDINQDNLNSRLDLTLPQNGTYSVVVTSVEFEGQGNYQLTVLPQL